MSFPHIRRFLFRPGAHRPGFALVISLIAVVLITGVVVAFFSRALLNRQVSFSSTNQIRADLLARSALDIVTGELRQEIVDFSTNKNGIYVPNAAANMLPAVEGVSGTVTGPGAVTLSKVAASGVPIDPGANGIPALGSSVTVDTNSRNGRNQSAWFTSGPNLGAANLPTWVYVARKAATPVSMETGSNDPTSNNYVIGRYTYTVYNTGGLVDANVAGCPPNSSNFSMPAATSGMKPSLAYADLTALDSTSTLANTLPVWRNAATGQSTQLFNEWASGIVGGTTPAASATPTPTPTSQDLMATAAAAGHLTAAAGDNVFLGRRDLMRFAVNKGISTSAVANLTHFSRSLDVPSWLPANTTAVKYGDNAYTSGQVNRFLPDVRYSANASVSRYHDDGTFDMVMVNAGDPLVSHRFSLAKMAWLGHNGPNAAAFSSAVSASQQATAIQACFGLTWNSTRNRWDYAHGEANNISLLDTVAAAGREPDFFELIQAGILSQSLGGQPGPGATNLSVTGTSYVGPAGDHFDSWSASTQLHVLQIGANMIDQADADNYPTAIYLQKYTYYGGTEDDLYNTVFGQENLPMLQRVGVVAAMLQQGPPVPASGPMDVWIVPEVWNPHESSTVAATVGATNYPTPSSLRMVTYGSVVIRDQAAPMGTATVNFGNDPTNPQVSGIVCFTNPVPSSTSPNAFFDHPVYLLGYSGTAANNYNSSACASGPTNQVPSSSNITPKMIGVNCGEITHTANGGYTILVDCPATSHLTFALEYYDGSSWRPYSLISRNSQIPDATRSAGGYSPGNPGDGNWAAGGQSLGHPDPRTSRFACVVGTQGAGQNPAWEQSYTVRDGPSASTYVHIGAAVPGNALILGNMPLSTAGFTQTLVTSSSPKGYFVDNWLQNLSTPTGTAENDVFPALAYYVDPDSVCRPADGWQGKVSTGDGMMTYHQTQTSAGSATATSVTRRRPVILNRPFRSVGELGYVFRDEPFKTLDFWSAKSADGGLLDMFCTVETKTPDVSAGAFNPNAAPASALQSVLQGTTTQASIPTTQYVKPTEAASMAAAAVSTLSASTSRLTNRADIAANLSATLRTNFIDTEASDTSTTQTDTNNANQGNKTLGEAPVRALASVSNLRTYNLLIDVVAQVGRLTPSATSFKDFNVEGERRYWLHLAIDRYTGKIIGQQLEPIND